MLKEKKKHHWRGDHDWEALSGWQPGEAEVYAAVHACSMGIRTRQMFEDLGVAMKVKLVYMDATVVLGSVKHVATQHSIFGFNNWCTTRRWSFAKSQQPRIMRT